MKQIPLTQGKFAIVDDEDYLYLSRFNWYLYNDKRGHYFAVRRLNSKMDGHRGYDLQMVDMIMCCGKGKSLQHLNRNGLDCRKQNLICVGWSSTRHNKKVQAGNHLGEKSSIYVGVSLRKGIKNPATKWRMMIQKQGIKYTSYHSSQKEAAIAYNKKAKKLYGKFAYQNKI